MNQKLMIYLLILILIPTFINSQTWNSTIDLNVSAGTFDFIDLYTNADGNHVLLHEVNSDQNDDEIYYYLFSYNGTQICSILVDSDFDQSPALSRISGFEDIVYITYKKSDYIYTKRTTNAGQSWTSLPTITLDDGTSNGLELWCDGDALHLSYSDYDENDVEYDTYYRKIDHEASVWSGIKRVTDYSGESGGFPSVTSSSSRVHVAYTEGTYSMPSSNSLDSKTRDKYLTNWQTPQNPSEETMRTYIIADDSKLHLFYYEFVMDGENWYGDLFFKNRNLGSTSWSSSTKIATGSDPDYAAVDMSISNSGDLNIVFDYLYYSLYFKSLDGSWSTNYYFGYGFSPKVSANNDDIYLLWIDWNDEELRLKQKDFDPLAPQNPDVTTSASHHPYITWDSNTEADLKNYKVYKKIDDGAWSYKATTTNTYYEDTSENIVHSGETMTAYYKIKAIDQTNNESNYSDVVDIEVEYEGLGFPELVIDPGQSIDKFLLYQNHPNPFNPKTNITFGIPEDNFVSLIVYNIQGEKVATLVNQQLSAGSYTAKFDGSVLPSGVYIYKIQAGSFSQIKRMLLIK